MTSRNQLRIIIGVIAIGVLLGAGILFGVKGGPVGKDHGESASASGAAPAAKGAHGGRLFTEGDYTLEISIF
jgi:hypothetical protein